MARSRLIPSVAIAAVVALGSFLAPGAASASESTVTVSGRLTLLSEGESTFERATLSVSGRGYLSVDLSGLADKDELGWGAPVRLDLVVPEGLPAAIASDDDFATLATYSTTVAPLVASSGAPLSFGPTAAMIGTEVVTTATHKIYAVLLTPSNVAGSAAAANQTAAKVQNAVNHANSYWLDQSGGKVGFELAGTTVWHKSSYPCDLDTWDLWDQAAGWAASELGYQAQVNTHLVAFLPSNVGSTCGVGGLGTIGFDANSGGVSYVVGTDSAYEKASLAHELGHNLSLGHSDWLACTTATPQLSLYSNGGCPAKEYGDAVDVMGGGSIDGRTGGALSGPSAIRSGLWSSSDYRIAPVGTSTYTLASLPSGTGVRSVVVQDSNGVEYFVEFRDLTGEDAQFGGLGCPVPGLANACAPTVAGVRVLALSPSSAAKGLYGEHVFLIGRTVSGVPRGNFTAGESFTQSSGLSVAVTAISGGTATIAVTRPSMSAAASSVYITQTSGSPLGTADDGDIRVGDRLTVFIGKAWRFDTLKVQWYRNGSAISGATKIAYTLTGSDAGKAIKVKVSGAIGSSKTTTVSDPASYYLGYGPVLKGEIVAGSVAIDNTATPLKAVPTAWTPGVSFGYQWLRNGAAITNATKSTYTPTSSDRGTLLSVRVKASRSGYTSSGYVFSAAKDYTVTASGSPAISGTVQVGKTLTVSSYAYSNVNGAIASPVRSYQWYRSGSAITNATSSSYALTASDYGKKITVKVTGGLPGWIADSQTSPATVAVIKGDIQQAPGTLTVSKPADSLVLTANTAAKILEPGVTVKYQWYRTSGATTTKITDATKSTHTLTKGSYGTNVYVVATVTKSNYNTVTVQSAPTNYSVTPSTPLPVITGTVALGTGTNTLALAARSYSAPGAATLAYQWYRDADAIPASAGGTVSTYTIVPKDVGHTLKVKVTASYPGSLTSVSTSAATQKVGLNALLGVSTALAVSETPLPTSRTLTVTGTGVTAPDASAVTTKYQWYRGSTAISGATAAGYTLTSSDYKKTVWVKVTVSKSGYTTVVKSTAPTAYSVVPAGAVTISGTAAVGSPLTVVAPVYAPTATSSSYQWYRDGVAITGATAASYTLVSADKGHYLTVKVKAMRDGYLPSSLTSGKTAKVTAP